MIVTNVRKQGHNETDQPSFTQPRMYEVIKNKKSALEIYINFLLEEGTLTKEDVEEHKKWYIIPRL
jgi:2-oxoglutarate dehydrogenase E1 component